MSNKPIQARVIFLVIFSFFGTAVPVAGDEGPWYEKSTLVVGNHQRKPVANNIYKGAARSIGKFSVTSTEGSVSIHNKETGKESSVQHDGKRKWALIKMH